jgi:hypothetical protein
VLRQCGTAVADLEVQDAVPAVHVGVDGRRTVLDRVDRQLRDREERPVEEVPAVVPADPVTQEGPGRSRGAQVRGQVQVGTRGGFAHPFIVGATDRERFW